jgi:hypothetical protein
VYFIRLSATVTILLTGSFRVHQQKEYMNDTLKCTRPTPT